jgi:ribosome biogenesis GTPase A
MDKYWRIVNDVLEKADMILLVMDARHIVESRNLEIEEKITSAGKPILYVINKCDLVDRKKVQKEASTLRPSVYISAKDHLGTAILREKIMILCKSIDHTIRVGVLGYPNVGKSSIINALKGKSSAKVSSMSGYTKYRQNVRVSSRIILIDTPGVIPYKEHDMYKQSIIGTINANRAKDPDLLILEILAKNPGMLEDVYGVETNDDKESVLEAIAIKKCVLTKGGKPDIERASRMILQDIQKGKS